MVIILVTLGVFVGCHVPEEDFSDAGAVPDSYKPVVGMSFGASLPEHDRPPLAAALLLTEPLTVADWNSKRCEITSGCQYGEVESGFYGSVGYSLGFAERHNLDDWMVVCPNLDCLHFMEPGGCPSVVDGNFILRDNRIYYPGVHRQYETYWNQLLGVETFRFLASVNLDGTDTRLEHTFSTAGISLTNGYRGSMYVSSEYAICSRSTLNDQGFYDVYVFVLDESGEHIVCNKKLESAPPASGLAWSVVHNTFGERMFFYKVDNSTSTSPHILTEDYQVKELNIDGLPEEGAYLSDNIYRCFRANDGYYDVNLETREETKLEEAQLENSHAFVVLPNCILESTLMGYTSLPMQSSVQQNAMKLFDGQRWWDVELPEELLEVKGKYLDVEAVTSDRILFCLRDEADPMNLGHVLYQIFLGTDRPVMEYAGTVEYQEPPESW